MSRRRLLIQYFADEGESDVSGAPGKTPEPSPEESRFSDFDTKSPLMSGGFSDEEDVTPPLGREDLERDSEPLAGPDEGEPTKDVPPEEIQEEKQPFRVLKAGGREIPVASEEELERLAAEGTQMQSVRDALNPYLPFLQAMRADPQFAQSVS
ncbi:MAG: hypothetical protein EOM93_07445, partial [Gammaproteobacteria bacterium]|nr:hypothetical protein [Gammaproteobacteria bacterium]